MKEYDLVIIGSGAAGEKAAIHATFHGFKVAIVERRTMLGGATVNTGTIPSKTLKETAIYLSGFYEKGRYGVDRELSHAADAKDFLFRERQVVSEESGDIRNELLKERVDIFEGVASFLDANRIFVRGESSTEELQGRFILIATGSYPAHPDGIPFDGKRVHDSDTILSIEKFPESLCIVGAGVIGCEYATTFATMGCKVKLVNSHATLLPFLDGEIVQCLVENMEKIGIEVMPNVHIDSVRIDGTRVLAGVAGGGEIEAEMFLYAAGRNGNVEDLNLDRIGLKATPRECIEVDDEYRTAVPSVFAVGDVIGFPALGSTSMDQGRVAVTHMFGLHDAERIASEYPFGIYTIPEASMIGLSEEKAKEKGLDYGTARCDYSEIPRGIIKAFGTGFLKLVYERPSLRVVGVHVIGRHATEIIHYGMEVVERGGTVTEIVGTIFNFPTLHELYKYAAYRAWLKESR